MQILKLLTRNRIIGNCGEKAAVSYLKKNKFKILEQNYIAHNNEIDIIAKNKEFLVFVEVKTRTVGVNSKSDTTRPAAAVTAEKQRKIISAARFYLACNPPEVHVRFDVIEVYLTDNKKIKRIHHIPSAFNANTAYTKNQH